MILKKLSVEKLMEQFLTLILLKILDFASNIYHKGKTSLKDVKDSQYKMFDLLNNLKKYEQKFNENKI